MVVAVYALAARRGLSIHAPTHYQLHCSGLRWEISLLFYIRLLPYVSRPFW